MSTKISSGSVVVTGDTTIWYCCGDWQLQNITNAIPCIPAYIPEDRLPKGYVAQKTIQVQGSTYVKIFGHYGLPLAAHREMLFPVMTQEGIIYPGSYGRMVFVRRENILNVSDPRVYREKMLAQLEGAREIFVELSRALGISIHNIGISGSVLAITEPCWRHETDFTIHDTNACETARRAISSNRQTGLFSGESKPPYHMPFRFMGKWFDPQFSSDDKERVFQGAQFETLETLYNEQITITDDCDGIYYPAIYSTVSGRRLITFRTSQRGLYRNEQRVCFEKITLARINYPDGRKEIAYLVKDDEWGEVID